MGVADVVHARVHHDQIGLERHAVHEKPLPHLVGVVAVVGEVHDLDAKVGALGREHGAKVRVDRLVVVDVPAVGGRLAAEDNPERAGGLGNGNVGAAEPLAVGAGMGAVRVRQHGARPLAIAIGAEGLDLHGIRVQGRRLSYERVPCDREEAQGPFRKERGEDNTAGEENAGDYDARWRRVR